MVVIGTGGVGVNAVQGARAAGANSVIAVDPVEFNGYGEVLRGDGHQSVDGGGVPVVRELTRGVMADRVVLTPGVLRLKSLPRR